MKYYRIDQYELYTLLETRATLERMRIAGVDNWQGAREVDWDVDSQAWGDIKDYEEVT